MLASVSIQGNTWPHREANATHDPVANEELLALSEENKIPLTLVPLDCTEEPLVLITPKVLRQIEKELGRNSFAFGEILSIAGKNSVYGAYYFGKTWRSEHFPFKKFKYTGVPLHDLTAAMVLIDCLRRKRDPLFKYAKKIPLLADSMGNIGLSRDYFNPKDHAVDIAGPITNKYWPEIVKLLKRYH